MQPAHVGLLSPVDRALTDMAFRLVAIGYVAFSLADVLTTAYALANGGRERNPLAASVYTSYGMGGLLAFKAGVVGVIVLTLRFMPRRPACWVGTVFVRA